MEDYRVAGSLGQRVQAARKSRGIRSAKALADLIGNGTVTESILQNIETGRLTNISVSQLLNIAFALKVAPGFLLAPVATPNRPVDLPNLSSGLEAMTSAEFDAWFSGSNAAEYRPTVAAEMAERNELAAFRELRRLSRDRLRIQLQRSIEQSVGAAHDNPAGWDVHGMKLAELDRSIEAVEGYLRSAGWPLEDLDM